MSMTALPVPILTDKTERTTCRLTGGAMTKVFDLGNPCVSDFLKPGQEGMHAPLCVAVGNDWPYLPQLTHSYSPEKMYSRYHYRSGTNETMREELSDVVEGALRRKRLADKDTWLDIACNDGTLLRYAYWKRNGIYTVGVDPSDVALNYGGMPGTPYILQNSFFDGPGYLAHHSPASIVTCIAMFYDLDNPVDFLKQVRSVMKDDGLFVLQLQYAPMILRHGEFDAICHEHLTYWNLNLLEYALQMAGLNIIDAEITASNGGSIRVYAMLTESAIRYRNTIEGMAGAERADCILVRERANVRDVCTQWEDLGRKARVMRSLVKEFLQQAKDENKTVVGYGASTKGNTLLQYFGIGPDLLPCIAERQTAKHGLVTAGSNIPIVSEEEMRKMKPDHLFVLPYHFATAFGEREKDLIAKGTVLVSPLHLP